MNKSVEMEKDSKEYFKFVRKDVSISGCLVSYRTNNNQRKIQQQLPIISYLPTSVQNYEFPDLPLNLATNYNTSSDLEKDQNWYYSTYELNRKCQPNSTDCNKSQMNCSLGYDSSCSSSSPEPVSLRQPVTFCTRSNFSKHQTDELEGSFASNPQPTRNERYLISKRVGLSENQVKYWFQNRRARVRKNKVQSQLKGNLEVLVQDIQILKELTGEEVVDVIEKIDGEKGKGK